MSRSWLGWVVEFVIEVLRLLFATVLASNGSPGKEYLSRVMSLSTSTSSH